MIVRGQGGTGKSTLLNVIMASFDCLDMSQLLKTAMSGLAASLIGGTKLHWFAGLPPQSIPQSNIWPDNSSKVIKDRQTKNLLDMDTLAIDEISMCMTDLFTLLSQVTGKVQADNGMVDSTTPFGGLNMVLIGDFHQLPPVGNASGALYCTPLPRNTSMVSKALYLQFLTVVTLTKQECIKDHQWTQILQRARVSECTEMDIRQVQKLVLTNPACAIPDFGSEPWSSAILVTPHNSVHTAWNQATICKHSTQTGNIIYMSEAEDSVGNSGSPLNMEQEVIVAHMKTTDAKGVEGTKKLHHHVKITIGMSVMIILN
jgi:hypothetical protein